MRIAEIPRKEAEWEAEKKARMLELEEEAKREEKKAARDVRL